MISKSFFLLFSKDLSMRMLIRNTGNRRKKYGIIIAEREWREPEQRLPQQRVTNRQLTQCRRT